MTEDVARSVQLFGEACQPLLGATAKTLGRFDYFGHAVGFSFNREGPVHRTWFGGLISLGVRAVVLYYLLILLNRTTTTDWRINSQVHAEYDESGGGGTTSGTSTQSQVHHLDSSNATFYLSIIDVGHGKYVDYDAEMQRFLKIESFQYEKVIGQQKEAEESSNAQSAQATVEEGTFKESVTSKRQARPCTDKELTTNQNQIHKETKPICFGDLKDYNISRADNGLTEKQVALSVKLCDGEGGIICESNPATILSTVENLQIQLSMVTNRANFSGQDAQNRLRKMHRTVDAFSPNMQSTKFKKLNLQTNDLVIGDYGARFFSFDEEPSYSFNPIGKLKNTLFMVQIGAPYERFVHVKEQTIWLDVIACLGGALYLLVALLSLIMWPIAELSFRSLAIQKMYKFKKTNEQDNESGKIIYGELKISFCEKLQIFFQNYLCYCLKVSKCFSGSQQRRSSQNQPRSIVDTYDTGVQRLSNDTSFEKTLDCLRELKTISTDLYKSEKLQNRLKHNPQKIISDIKNDDLIQFEKEEDNKVEGTNWFKRWFKFKKKEQKNFGQIAPNKYQENSPRFAKVREKIDQMDETISRYQSERSFRKSLNDHTSVGAGHKDSFISNTHRRLLSSNRSQSALEKKSPFKTRNFSLEANKKSGNLKDNSKDETKITVDSFILYEKDEFELGSNPKTESMALRDHKVSRTIPEPASNQPTKNTLNYKDGKYQQKEEKPQSQSGWSHGGKSYSGKPPVQRNSKDSKDLEPYIKNIDKQKTIRNDSKSNSRIEKQKSEDIKLKDKINKENKVSNVTITISKRGSEKSKERKDLDNKLKKVDEQRTNSSKHLSELMFKSDENFDKKPDQWSDQVTHKQETRGPSESSKRHDAAAHFSVTDTKLKKDKKKLEKEPSSNNILTLEQIANDQFNDIEPVDEEEDFDYSGEGEGQDGEDSGEINIDSYLQSEVVSSHVVSTKQKSKVLAQKKLLKSKTKSKKKKKKNTPR